MKAGLHAKVFAAVALVAVTLVLALSAYYGYRLETTKRSGLEGRAQGYALLAARQLEPVLTNGDPETANAVFDSLSGDLEFHALAIYRDDGVLLAGRGQLNGPRVVRVAAPVRARDGSRGTVVVELTTQLMEADIAASHVRAFFATVIALTLGLACAWLIGRHIATRIGDLATAAAEAAGSSNVDATTPFVDASSDEIGRLSGSFNTMVARLLAAQGREIELLLANVAEGFVIVDAHGRMGARHSAVMGRWFGSIAKGAPVWSLFERDDANRAAFFELAWESLFDGFLPAEVALDQFPKRLRHGSSVFELVVRPIQGETDGALVVLTDVTEAIRREELDATRSDLVALCERALLDRASVIDFIDEGDSLQRVIEIGETLIDLKRAVHTLKGAAAQNGASSIAAACAEVEAGMLVSESGAPRPVDLAALVSGWRVLTGRLRSLFTGSSKRPVHVERTDLDALVTRIESGAEHEELGRHARLLRLEPVQIRLDRAKDGAVALARRLGKDIEVSGTAGPLRCDAAVWRPLWSAFGHVVRNAVDHGIESAEVRISAGKSPRGRLKVGVERRDDCLLIEATDDGAGIDWPGIAKRAAARGLPFGTSRDLEDALFADGLSTVEEAHEVSGQGIGLGAIRAVAEAMGGRVTIASERGVGTTVVVEVPLAMLGDAYRTIAA